MPTLHVSPRSCSSFCAASTAANVPVRADEWLAIDIANISSEEGDGPGQQSGRDYRLDSENPASEAVTTNGMARYRTCNSPSSSHV